MHRVVWSQGLQFHPLVQGHAQGQDRFNYSLISKNQMRAAADSAPSHRLHGFSPGRRVTAGFKCSLLFARPRPRWRGGWETASCLHALSQGCRSSQAPTRRPFLARGPGKSSVPVMCGCASR